jgi:hypothetical protein
VNANASLAWIWLGGGLFTGSLAVCSAISLVLHARLLSRLRSTHQVLWLNLGTPTLWHVVLYGISRGYDSIYFDWLSTIRGDDSGDDEVTALATRLRQVFYAETVGTLAGVAALTVGYLRLK